MNSAKADKQSRDALKKMMEHNACESGRRKNTTLEKTTIRAIESVLSIGDRAEVIPAPGGGVKVIHIQKTLIADTSKKTK